jgi:hypothetical protein
MAFLGACASGNARLAKMMLLHNHNAGPKFGRINVFAGIIEAILGDHLACMVGVSESCGMSVRCILGREKFMSTICDGDSRAIARWAVASNLINENELLVAAKLTNRARIMAELEGPQTD